MQYTDEETGITITILSTMYIDWGIQINDRNGDELFYGPCHIDSESVGFHREDDDGNELEEAIDWFDEDWQLWFQSEFEVLVDGFVGWENLTDDYPKFEEE